MKGLIILGVSLLLPIVSLVSLAEGGCNLDKYEHSAYYHNSARQIEDLFLEADWHFERDATYMVDFNGNEPPGYGADWIFRTCKVDQYVGLISGEYPEECLYFSKEGYVELSEAFTPFIPSDAFLQNLAWHIQCRTIPGKLSWALRDSHRGLNLSCQVLCLTLHNSSRHSYCLISEEQFNYLYGLYTAIAWGFTTGTLITVALIYWIFQR